MSSALGASASDLTNVPLSPHSHIVLTRNNNQPEWWNVNVLPVTDPAVYNQISTSANPYATYQSLVAANNSGVLGPVPTNIFLWFQTLPGVVPNRVAGADRIGTSVAASIDQFPAGSASSVVLARDDAYPDAMVAGPLARKNNGPVLLTASSSLSATTQAEIKRVLSSTSDPIYLVGGEGAISPAVATQLTSAGYTNVKRLAGPTRYGTATAVADALGNPSTVFLATGEDFPDALSAGPAASTAGGAVLLTQGGSLGSVTSAYLSAHHPSTLFAIGGPACAADSTATCEMGANRYETSMKVAAKWFSSAQSLGIATGTAFPDALSAAPDMASRNGPILLVPPTGTVPSAVTTQLAAYQAQQPQVRVFGGPGAVSDAIVNQVVASADGTSS